MCGIVAYIGHREAYPIIIKGLQRLEYRGYDSAGVAILNGDLKVYKKAGKVSDLHDFVKGKDMPIRIIHNPGNSLSFTMESSKIILPSRQN